MKPYTNNLDDQRVVTDLFAGVGLLLVVIVAGCILYKLAQDISIHRVIITVKFLSGVTLLWVVGHCINGRRHWKYEDYCCPACAYKHTNLFTEWWHRRRCLPFLTKYQ